VGVGDEENSFIEVSRLEDKPTHCGTDIIGLGRPVTDEVNENSALDPGHTDR
jgi:hypothetical protein